MIKNLKRIKIVQKYSETVLRKSFITSSDSE